MYYKETFSAYGNPNVKVTHRTTIMTTKDAHLTQKGDCIAAIKAEKALADLGRIPEFTAMLGEEMDRLGLCRYCGCQLPNDDRPNCSQCGGPREDRT